MLRRALSLTKIVMLRATRPSATSLIRRVRFADALLSGGRCGECPVHASLCGSPRCVRNSGVARLSSVRRRDRRLRWQSSANCMPLAEISHHRPGCWRRMGFVAGSRAKIVPGTWATVAQVRVGCAAAVVWFRCDGNAVHSAPMSPSIRRREQKSDKLAPLPEQSPAHRITDGVVRAR